MAGNSINRYHFSVDWGGSRIGFAEVSGLDIEIEAVSVRDGSSAADSGRKIPGIRKFSNITLKRGIIKGDNDFFNWINTKSVGNIERRDLTINLLDESHSPIFTWQVKSAFPVKYIGPILISNDSEIALETLELTHEGLTVIAQ
ncbi:phage tail protein [Pedobacter fastidiosus]|uniref:Phage tail protein n=1 Tax=Pedobacter fastidiosus TaxID=2765361 RepID=A0ABR7KRB2_9SPHI|nr:phage tail protein [Pedobacter fastidiosus]MBC6110390.1 phage tail protein [Pedobacter fastidiosus]